MNCETARARLLESESPRGEAPDLREDGAERVGARLAAHLADCSSCRSAADDIAAALEGLVLDLDATLAPFTEAEAVRLATGTVGYSRTDRRRGVPRWRSRLSWGTAVGVAAVSALIWISSRVPTTTDGWSAYDPALDAEPVFSVEAPGARLAVFQTQNPKISVVWLY